jgi:hypothetical protein
VTSTVRPSCRGISRARPYLFLVDLPLLRLDPASTTIGQQRDHTRTSTTENHTSSTAPGMFHRPVINITMTPQVWPACTGARRYSNIYSARPAFSSKAPPRVFFVDLDPPLESIKGEGKELSRRERTSRSTPQAILHFSFLRLGTSSLSHSL